VELNQSVRRTRYFTAAELDCLTAALAAYPDRDAADAIRLLLFTRARRLEALSMRWADLDLASGAWTKQKLLHRAPLSTPARELLAGIRARSPADAVFVFPGRGAAGHRRELQEAWRSISKAAGIVGARLHDLRQSLALILASGDASPLIGDLLGHPQPSTPQNPRPPAPRLRDGLRKARVPE
jgi:integrase